MTNYYKPEDDTTSELIRRCATALDNGADVSTIRSMCAEAGKGDDEAFLIYVASQLLSLDSR
jgi:hypothetical protein